MEIKKIRVDRAKSGMVVAADVYTADEQLIIPKDTTLNEKSVERLAYYFVEEIVIYVESIPRKEQENSAETNIPEYERKIRATREFKEFSSQYDKLVEELKRSSQDMIEMAETLGIVPEEKLLSGVNSILSKSRNGLHTLEMMHCMRVFDDMTYVHSVNVSLLCYTIGEWLGYTPQELRDITLAGLLHDIGKLKIPPALIKKPGKLTNEEYSLVKNHAVCGYEILKKTSLDKEIILPALCHHERCDGSGYPLGVTAQMMSEFSKVVAVADVYDAMTADRVYRKGICPFEVIENFENEGIEKYDPTILLTFLNKIIQSYIGTEVLLSDGKKGEVVMINTRVLSKPMVKVGTEFIDLSRTQNLRIEEVVR